ncbi:MAG: hypothetical protein P8X95_14840 [Anaerolineales bacterium]|jgi:hypothetical protein
MVDEVILYISAAQDLEYERDLIGRAVTEVPVSLGWRVEQTPHTDKSPDLEAIAHADVHLLLLGGDIRAPVGLELLVARRAGNKPVFLMKKDAMHTPAAEVFRREISKRETWQTFKDISDLRYQVLDLLAGHLLDQATRYALRSAEYENLKSWHEELEKSKKEPVEETRGGAGESGIIISTERYVPSEGVLIEKPKKKGP